MSHTNNDTPICTTPGCTIFACDPENQLCIQCELIKYDLFEAQIELAEADSAARNASNYAKKLNGDFEDGNDPSTIDAFKSIRDLKAATFRLTEAKLRVEEAKLRVAKANEMI